MRKLLGLVLLLALLAGGLGVFLLNRLYQGFQGEVFVDIPKGAGVRTIARRLAEAGVLENQWQLLAASTLKSRPLLAGEYRFWRAANTWEVYDRLARGDVFFRELAVPEGSNIFDIANAAAATGIIDANEFLKLAADPKPVHDIAPKAPSLEGYLFPAVYHVAHKTTAADLIAEMTSRFRREWKQAASDTGVQSPDVHAAVTLASLVEKETGAAAERPLVASVFRNRLQQGMPLQCDPTTIYAALLEERYRGTIHQSDLKSDNPYNTYRHSGLPPGAIANPGAASLRAALKPAETDYVYFVAKPDQSGAHTFSKELASHAAAVREYRRGLQQAQQTGAAPPNSRAKPPANR